ncbi:hypothetical protein [Paracoccus spongiarum]|uniref:Uncharacterized protein n=1 Tax=Paracoccus spongiarum TaxID=3064387 RepID=A0ABT9JGB1_9RHOB|nr:hypothetical protein [Paracoccus sp. 2205BS29-5]MDP5308848.1 hypothetical protein [Paracoccus sp. 2205BS29-5]
MADAASMLAVTMAGLCCLAQAGEVAPATITARQPVTLCDAAGRPGDLRAVLTVLSLTSPEDGTAPAPRIAVEADTGETTLIGLFPANDLSDPDAARQFFLPGGGAARCWTLRLTGPGRAQVTLTRSQPLE